MQDALFNLEKEVPNRRPLVAARHQMTGDRLKLTRVATIYTSPQHGPRLGVCKWSSQFGISAVSIRSTPMSTARKKLVQFQRQRLSNGSRTGFARLTRGLLVRRTPT